MIERIVKPDNPEFLDIAIGDIQQGLADNIVWLDHVFGKSERLVKNSNFRKRIYTPNAYIRGNEYVELSPNTEYGNFCFFYVPDVQEVECVKGISATIRANVRIIFWLNYADINNNGSTRNKEQIKKQILDVLNGGFHLHRGSLNVTRIYEEAENIYEGFDIDEIDNQFLMQPYGGFRFDADLTIQETCK